MTRFLLSQPGSEGLFLLSEVISHDPLENYSGKQWARGGRHENPSLKQCVQNAVALQALGNCQRKRRLSDGEPKINDIPLPKRKWSKTQKWLLYIASIVHTCIWNKLSHLRCHGDVTMVIQTHKWACIYARIADSATTVPCMSVCQTTFLSPIDFVVFFISCLYTYIQLAASEKPLIVRHTDSSTVSSSEMMFSEMSVQYNWITSFLMIVLIISSSNRHVILMT